jgi:hypothetical protein
VEAQAVKKNEKKCKHGEEYMNVKGLTTRAKEKTRYADQEDEKFVRENKRQIKNGDRERIVPKKQK